MLAGSTYLQRVCSTNTQLLVSFSYLVGLIHPQVVGNIWPMRQIDSPVSKCETNANTKAPFFGEAPIVKFRPN